MRVANIQYYTEILNKCANNFNRCVNLTVTVRRLLKTDDASYIILLCYCNLPKRTLSTISTPQTPHNNARIVCK